uniref:E3 ubiquitin-protein ligase HERC2 n=1 Tax=Anthurium amnicola TaxID=1678845 RepID=A0A1D1YZQ5_9ARAE
MNGGGEGGVEAMEEEKERIALMWGYLPGASPQRTPLLSPVPVTLPRSTAGDAWRDVCGGGCGFAMAISESGMLMTWGSTDDLGQSYLTSGKHEETPEAFPLPTETAIVKAAAGWAHCVAVTAHGEVYTWGWKECVPSGKVTGDQSAGGLRLLEKDALERQSTLLSDQVSPRSQGPKSGEESTKRRRTSSSKQSPECSSGDENLSAVPCLVTLGPGVRIINVAAGGRHTLALSGKSACFHVFLVNVGHSRTKMAMCHYLP